MLRISIRISSVYIHSTCFSRTIVNCPKFTRYQTKSYLFCTHVLAWFDANLGLLLYGDDPVISSLVLYNCIRPGPCMEDVYSRPPLSEVSVFVARDPVSYTVSNTLYTAEYSRCTARLSYPLYQSTFPYNPPVY